MKNCNKCENINITEQQQHLTNKHTDHECTKYGKRVIHRSQTAGIHSFLYPCDDCCNDDHIFYKERD